MTAAFDVAVLVPILLYCQAGQNTVLIRFKAVDQTDCVQCQSCFLFFLKKKRPDRGKLTANLLASASRFVNCFDLLN